MTVRILGLEIDRKTDILAFAAFLLSLSGIGYQLFFFFRGADVHLMPPAQIILYSQSPSLGKPFLTVIATMAHVNSGGPGYNSVITKESIDFELNNKLHHYNWFQIVQLQEDLTTYGKTIKIINSKPAGAYPVTSGSAEVHDTLFGPRYSEEMADVDSFAKSFSLLLEDSAERHRTSMEFALHSETLNDGVKTVKCIAELTAADVQKIRKPDIGWAALTCTEDGELRND